VICVTTATATVTTIAKIKKCCSSNSNWRFAAADKKKNGWQIHGECEILYSGIVFFFN